MNDVNYTRAGAAVALSLLLAACAGMSYAPVKYSNGLMTGANGMTLYTFDKDAIGSGKSARTQFTWERTDRASALKKALR